MKFLLVALTLCLIGATQITADEDICKDLNDRQCLSKCLKENACKDLVRNYENDCIKDIDSYGCKLLCEVSENSYDICTQDSEPECPRGVDVETCEQYQKCLRADGTNHQDCEKILPHNSEPECPRGVDVETCDNYKKCHSEGGNEQDCEKILSHNSDPECPNSVDVETCQKYKNCLSEFDKMQNCEQILHQNSEPECPHGVSIQSCIDYKKCVSDQRTSDDCEQYLTQHSDPGCNLDNGECIVYCKDKDNIDKPECVELQRRNRPSSNGNENSGNNDENVKYCKEQLKNDPNNFICNISTICEKFPNSKDCKETQQSVPVTCTKEQIEAKDLTCQPPPASPSYFHFDMVDIGLYGRNRKQLSPRVKIEICLNVPSVHRNCAYINRLVHKMKRNKRLFKLRPRRH